MDGIEEQNESNLSSLPLPPCPHLNTSFDPNDALEVALASLKAQIATQISSSFCRVSPLFSDKFLQGTYYNSSLEDINTTNIDELLKIAPRSLGNFENWLSSLDPTLIDQHARICDLMEDLLDKSSKIYMRPTYMDYDDMESEQDGSAVQKHLEAELASAICESGLVCILGPRGSGKSYLLHRVLSRLTNLYENQNTTSLSSDKTSHDQGLQHNLLPTPAQPLLVIHLAALQTQDPLDLIRYILHDLQAVLNSHFKDNKEKLFELEKISNQFEQIRLQLHQKLGKFDLQDESRYYRSRLHLQKENYNIVLATARKMMIEASRIRQIVLVVEDFELLTGERQTFLYNIIDLMSLKMEPNLEERMNRNLERRKNSKKRKRNDTDHEYNEEFDMNSESGDDINQFESRIAVTSVFMTSCLDSFSLLEKRVSSRFPQRQIILNHPTSLNQMICLLLKHLLIVPLPLPTHLQLLLERRKGHYLHRKDLFLKVEMENAKRKEVEDEYVGFQDVPIAPDDVAFVLDDTSLDLEHAPMHLEEYEETDDDPDYDRGLHHIPLLAMKDQNCFAFQCHVECRELCIDWNDSILEIFQNPSLELQNALHAVHSISTSPKTFYNIFHVALSQLRGPKTAGPNNEKYLLSSYDVSKACRAYIKQMDGRVKLTLSCSPLEILLLIEMNRLEARISAGIQKLGSPLIDINLPAAAKAIDLGSAQAFTKAGRLNLNSLKSPTQFDNSLPETKITSKASSQSENLQYYHFERVYFEYSKWIMSNPSLKAFRFPKNIIRKSFEHLLSLKLIRLASKQKYHYTHNTKTISPVMLSYQPVKIMLTKSQLETVLDEFEGGLPDLFHDRLCL